MRRHFSIRSAPVVVVAGSEQKEVCRLQEDARVYLSMVIWRVFERIISIYTKFAQALSTQMASHIFSKKFWLESAVSKYLRMEKSHFWGEAHSYEKSR